jgi:hypothetical protein
MGYWSKSSGKHTLVHGYVTTFVDGSTVNPSTYPNPNNNPFHTGTVPRILASGKHAINMTANSPHQTNGFGVTGDFAGAFAGVDANVTGKNSVSIGGYGLTTTDTATVVVPYLKMQYKPLRNDTLHNVLAWDYATGKIKVRYDNTFSGGSSVTSVTGTSPIASSGGTTPAISIANADADGTTKGAATFTASDFNATTGLISLDYTNGQKATTSLPGFLNSTDWNTFNNKASTSSPTIATPSFTTGFTIGGAATSRKMMVGNGTNFVPSTETWAVPGTSGNVLISDGTNWTSGVPSTSLTGAITYSSDITPTLTANQNDYNPTGLSTTYSIRATITGSATNWNITGLAGGATGRLLNLINNSAVGSGNTITLKNNDAGSTSLNRFLFTTGDFILLPGENVQLQYSGGKWKSLGFAARGGNGITNTGNSYDWGGGLTKDATISYGPTGFSSFLIKPNDITTGDGLFIISTLDDTTLTKEADFVVNSADGSISMAGGNSGSQSSIKIDTDGELIITVSRTSCAGAPTNAVANISGVLTICP